METFTPGPRPTDRTQLADWYTAILNEQERSGLSMAKFAKSIGAHVVTLYSWKRRLTSPISEPAEPAPELVRVMVKDTLPQQPEDHSTFVLHLGNGRTIEIPADFSEAGLTRIVQTLEAC